MREALVIGNWKMNGSFAELNTLATELKAQLGEKELNAVSVGVCPPMLHIGHIQDVLAGGNIEVGAQSCAAHDNGAYTGEVSASMLSDAGCTFALVGHSERRSLFGEDDAVVVAKVAQLLSHGLRVVLCVGESLAQRDAGETIAVVRQQLESVLHANDAQALKHLVVAYEPVWAIGTGRTASPQQAQEVHAELRKVLGEWSPELADCSILYGGSVKAANSEELFAQEDIDGGLIGGAALNAAEFAAICRAAA